MFKNLMALPKSFLHFILMRALFILSVFSGLVLLTIFIATLMLLNWHWVWWLIFVVCLSPWLVMILVFGILTLRSVHDLRYKKQNWISLRDIDSAGLLFQIISLVGLFKRRK